MSEFILIIFIRNLFLSHWLLLHNFDLSSNFFQIAESKLATPKLYTLCCYPASPRSFLNIYLEKRTYYLFKLFSTKHYRQYSTLDILHIFTYYTHSVYSSISQLFRLCSKRGTNSKFKKQNKKKTTTTTEYFEIVKTLLSVRN